MSRGQPANVLDRLSAKSEFTATGCLLWRGYLDRDGYGQIGVNVGRGKPYRIMNVHKVAFEAICEPVPAGMELDHLCRVRNCWNPLHLEVVTHRENVLRGTSPLAQNARKRFCKHGHLLEGDNLRAGNARRCRACIEKKRPAPAVRKTPTKKASK